MSAVKGEIFSDNKTKQKWKARMPAVTGEIFQMTNFEKF